MDNVDKWTINFKSLAYNIGAIEYITYYPFPYIYLIIVHNIHNQASWAFADFCNYPQHYPQTIHKPL